MIIPTQCIKRFEKGGIYYDPSVSGQSIRDELRIRLGLRYDNEEHVKNTRRAETRQAYAALHLFFFYGLTVT